MMVDWVEGSDKRKLTNGPVLKSFYDNETDQWVGPNDNLGLLSFQTIPLRSTTDQSGLIGAKGGDLP